MLLLRNTQTLIEDFQAFRRRDGGNDDCEDQFNGVTDLAIFLAVFYYVPLVVFMVIAGLWVFSVIRQVDGSLEFETILHGLRANFLVLT